MSHVVKVVVEMEKIECDDASDAFHVVDEVLDAGDFQDAINEHEFDAGSVLVKSVVVRGS